MKILVTGANGQLGKTFKKLQKNYLNLSFFFEAKNVVDITNKPQLKKYLEQNKIEAIINCAAYTNVKLAEKEYDLAYKINVEAIKNLVELTKELSLKLIHISTDYVFDGKQTKPYKITLKTNPINTYGKTKDLGEKVLIEANLPNVFVVRTSWLYSEFNNNFVKTIARIASEKNEIEVVANQIGSPTYASDLAGFILKFLIGKTSEDTEIYHYANKAEVSWFEFAKEIVNQLSLKTKVLEKLDDNEEVKRPAFSVLNCKKVEKEFNVEILDWRQSLKRCLVHLKNK